MNKEFEALEEIFKIIYNLDCGTTFEQDKKLNECRDVLNQALTELQAIKEAKPSEALEKLEEIKNYFPYVDLGNGQEYVCQKEFNTITKALIKAQEQEKVLEIIKGKNVDINYLRFEAVDVKQYNDYIQQLNKVSTISHWCLTQEEFDILKRWQNG